jgi:hypothetical protein
VPAAEAGKTERLKFSAQPERDQVQSFQIRPSSDNMVNTRASNATKRPGLILVSPKEKRRTREEMQAVRAEKEAANATKQAAENANDILRQEAKLQLAEMEVMEEERAQEESKRSRRRSAA